MRASRPLQSTRGSPCPHRLLFFSALSRESLSGSLLVRRVVSVAATWLDGVSASDAIAIALWLHVGTAVSATGALRGEIIEILREAAATPRSLPQPVPFLIVSTVVTGVVGVPLFLVLGGAADRFGAMVMVVIGVAMLVTAWVIRRRTEGLRARQDVDLADAVLVGAAQGLAVIPGLSRTGLTLATLLGRGYSQREAVVLSVLMGIPASVGAGVLALVASDMEFGLPAVIGLVTAAAVGAVTIRTVLAWASRVRLAPFVAVTGGVVAVGAVLGLVSGV